MVTNARVRMSESRVREPLVQHEVHDDARDGNVHPQGPGPARDRAMLGIARLQSAVQSDDRHWNDDDGQRNMRNQNRKINRTRPALAEKPNVSDFKVEE